MIVVPGEEGRGPGENKSWFGEVQMRGDREAEYTRALLIGGKGHRGYIACSSKVAS